MALYKWFYLLTYFILTWFTLDSEYSYKLYQSVTSKIGKNLHICKKQRKQRTTHTDYTYLVNKKA